MVSMHRRWLWSAALASMAGIALASQDATKAQPGADAQTIEHWVERLDSDDLDARIEATRMLSIMQAGITLKELEAQLARPELSPETRERLLIAAHSRFKTSPRGAIGVSFDVTSPGAVVSTTVENFDSVRKLQAGDRILSIDGVPVNSVEQVRALVISHDPDEVAMIQVRRGGQTREIPLTLGSFADLSETRMIAEQDYDAAWRVRLGRLMVIAGAEPLASPLKHTESRAIDRRIRLEEARRERARSATPPDADADDARTPEIIAGGRGRSDAAQALANWSSTLATEQLRRGVSGNAQIQLLENENRQTLEALKARLAELRLRLRRGDMPEQLRIVFRQEEQLLEAEIRRLQALLPLQR